MHTRTLNDKLFDKPQNGWKMQYFQWHSIIRPKLTRQVMRVLATPSHSQTYVYKTSVQRKKREKRTSGCRMSNDMETRQLIDVLK